LVRHHLSTYIASIYWKLEKFISPFIDMAAKRHKKHKNKISHLIISIGYEIEIR
jgi:hypothetical protein